MSKRYVSGSLLAAWQLPREMNEVPKESHSGALSCFVSCKDLSSDFWKKRALTVLRLCFCYGLRQEMTVDISSFQPHTQCLPLLGDISNRRSLTSLKISAQNHSKHFISHLHLYGY